jgi:hypothetical protein
LPNCNISISITLLATPLAIVYSIVTPTALDWLTANPPFCLLLGVKFAEQVPAPVGPCDLHAPNAVCLHRQ